jgi:hypothetical protein
MKPNYPETTFSHLNLVLYEDQRASSDLSFQFCHKNAAPTGDDKEIKEGREHVVFRFHIAWLKTRVSQTTVLNRFC